MKRWLILMFLLSPAWAAIAVTSHPAAVTNSVASLTCANGVAITGTSGHLFAIIVSLPAGGTVSSVADNGATGGNTYIQGPVANNASGGHLEIWYTISTKAATIVTATFASQKNSCAVIEYSGVSGVNTTYPINTGGPTNTPTITTATTAANSWMLVGMSDAPATATWTAGTTCSGGASATCTLESSIAGGSTTTPGVAVEDDGNSTAAGSVTLNATLSVSTKTWAVGGIELMTTLPTPTMNPNGGSFNNDTSTAFSDTQAGVTFCSTLDGSTPAATTPPTCSTGSSGASTTVIATATTVKVLATKSGWTNSAVLSSSVFTLTVGAVTDSPGAGTYTSAQTATLGITTTTGGTVHFTQDNTAATCSSGAYSAPFSVSATEHVRAVGCKTNYVTSGELNDLYTINLSTCAQSLTLMGIGCQ